MPFITDFRQELIDGKAIRRKDWPAGFKLCKLNVNDENSKPIAGILVLFQPTPTPEVYKPKTYIPVWPEIVADDWELAK